MIHPDDIYYIGKIGKPHGVKGEVSFHFEDDVFDRVEADFLFIETDGLPVPFFIEEYRFRSAETALMTFDGIDTQEKARKLTGCSVFFPRTLADEDEENTSFAALVGYTVVDAESGESKGTVVSIDTSTINLLLEIETPNKENVLVPLHDDLVNTVDKARKTLTLTLPEGIFDL